MYTIKPKYRPLIPSINQTLQTTLKEHGTFCAETRERHDRLELPRVRLIKAEPYYGNTPLADERSRWRGWKPKNYRFLSWERWVEFNGLVNDVLDGMQCEAEVWSKPQSTRNKLWIRRGGARRENYDYEAGCNAWGHVVTTIDEKGEADFGHDVTLRFPDLSEVE